jgi:hypothetical protein
MHNWGLIVQQPTTNSQQPTANSQQPKIIFFLYKSLREKVYFCRKKKF